MPEITFIARHEVNKDDTLSGIALKYYGSAAKDLWMLISEANKDVIGPNPNLLRPGIVLQIPAKTTQFTQPATDQPKPAAANEPALRRHLGDESTEPQ